MSDDESGERSEIEEDKEEENDAGCEEDEVKEEENEEDNEEEEEEEEMTGRSQALKKRVGAKISPLPKWRE